MAARESENPSHDAQMFKTAFSTVACPEWTLARVARAAAEYGYDGIELRTEGHGGRRFACDPALTAAAKVREVFEGAGTRIACLATGVRFDEPIRPPVIGRVISDTERSVRQAKSMIDLAAQIEAPFVRVFAFEHSRRERRKAAVARIVDRLRHSLDAARNTGVRLVIENGGSFPRAGDVMDLVETLDDPLLGVAYSMPVAHAAGEDPAEGVAMIRSRLWTVKIKDYKGHTPCPLGQGDQPCEQLVRALESSGFDGWIVYEWDRAWLPDLDPPDAALAAAAQTVYGWLGRTSHPRTASAGT
jgi:sugar phosphate isomerase/epimerase